jgi:metallo-beta-lactamase family protein
MTASITFLGASGTVTGSKYLLHAGGQQVLIDCGLFQGYKQLRLRNWTPLPIAPNQVDAVILTHAHLDHSGYLPLLVKEGFAGHVYCTLGTKDLCKILLPDSGHIQEEDAFYAGKHGFSRHEQPKPLYTKQDALDCLPLLKAQPFSQKATRSFSPLPGWKCSFTEAGHILGAASLLIEVQGRRILFSGDLGRTDDLLMNPPAAPPAADTVVVESTYGDRDHPAMALLQELGPALARLAKRGGVAVVPVFAVGRAQAILHAINVLKQSGVVPKTLPVFLDSPMAVNTTQLMEQHLGHHRLDAAEVAALRRNATMVSSVDDSKALGGRRGPMVILSASGMATGGRVLHHMARHAGSPKNMILLTGYQAPGTRGAHLAAGEKSVRIHGQDVAVQAEVVPLQAASAHADRKQLLAWLQSMPQGASGAGPRQVYVTHGEPLASDALRQQIERQLGWQALVPEHGSTWQV